MPLPAFLQPIGPDHPMLSHGDTPSAWETICELEAMLRRRELHAAVVPYVAALAQLALDASDAAFRALLGSRAKSYYNDIDWALDAAKRRAAVPSYTAVTFRVPARWQPFPRTVRLPSMS